MSRIASGFRLLSSPLAVYAMVNVLAAASTFLLVPVLLRLFDVEEFGRWALIEPVLFFGTVLVLGGVEHGAMKQIAYEEEDPRRVTGELALTGAPLVVLGAALVSLAAIPFVGQTGSVMLGMLVAIEGFIALLLSAARAAGRTGAFATGHVGRTALVLLVALAAYLLGPSRPWTVEEFLVLRTVVAAVVLLALVAMMRPVPRFSMSRYRDAFVYGVFILATGLLNMVMDVMDRYILGFGFDLETVAVYTIHVKLASLVAQGIVMPFSLWFAPERLRHIDDPDGGASFFNKVAIGLLIVSCYVFGVTLLSANLLIDLIAPGVALDRTVLAFLLGAAIAIGMSYALNIGLLKPGRTHLNVLGIAVGLAVTSAVSLALVEGFGPAGVAAAKFLGTCCFTATLAALSRKEHPVRFGYGIMLLIVIATFALIFTLEALVPWAGYAGAAARVGLLTAVAVAIVAVILSGGARRADRVLSFMRTPH